MQDVEEMRIMTEFMSLWVAVLTATYCAWTWWALAPEEMRVAAGN